MADQAVNDAEHNGSPGEMSMIFANMESLDLVGTATESSTNSSDISSDDRVAGNPVWGTSIPGLNSVPSLTHSVETPPLMAEPSETFLRNNVLGPPARSLPIAVPHLPHAPQVMRTTIERGPIPLPVSRQITAAGNSATGEDTRTAGTQTEPGDVPREELIQLTADTAQSYLPPEACLFAANLPMNWGDEQIHIALEVKFKHFGTMFVKVKRDPTNLPVAFLQYEVSLLRFALNLF